MIAYGRPAPWLLLGFFLLVACSRQYGGVLVSPPATNGGEMSADNVRVGPTRYRHACAQASAGFARCAALIGTTPWQGAVETATTGPRQLAPGFGARDLEEAYTLDIVRGTGAVVAIVTAFDDPNVANDLAEYRSYSNLAPCAAGCLNVVNQTGGSTLPSPNVDWAFETSLDVDMVSANCPNCSILVVEANTNGLADLGAAMRETLQIGATTIANAYFAPEFHGEEIHNPYVSNRPITAAGGDDGYTRNGDVWPAASVSVTAVGGTVLARDPSVPRGWIESAWPSTGSGCSTYVNMPFWQQGTLCPATRATNDVAYAAAGIAVYDTYGPSNYGWEIAGGTGAGAAAIAAIYALAGNARVIHNAQHLYVHANLLNDVTAGSNGSGCPPILCTAGPGWDGPTGNGTPNDWKAL